MKRVTDGPSFEVTDVEIRFIHEIALRAKKLGHHGQTLTLEMDITAAHANGCPLELAKLLAFPDLDFMHDVTGIQRHIYRPTGKLENCFVPRCAARTQKSELEEPR